MDSAICEAESRMKKPGILLVGRKFYIKIEDIIIPLSTDSLVSAVSSLISYYFILRCKYPPLLHHVFAFFEYMFGFKKVSASQPAKRLWGVLGSAV